MLRSQENNLRDGKYVAMTRCYFCGEADRIVLHNKFGDVSEMHDKIIDMEPCNKCKGWMDQGIMLLGIEEAKCEPGWNKPKPGEQNFIPNPYRSGRLVVIREEAFDRLIENSEMEDEVKQGMIGFAHKHRFMFMESEVVARIAEASGQGQESESSPE